VARQLLGRNPLRPHVPPVARSPSTRLELETCNHTSYTCSIIFSHTLLYDHRRTITITRRDPMCFLRRFLLGDRRRNTALLIPLARTLCCLFFCFCFSLLIWSLLPISLFISFWISKCSHLSLSPCCPGFYTREEVDHGEYVDVAFSQELSVGEGEVDFAGDETCHF